MSPWQLVLVLSLGAAAGWVGRVFEETAIRERAVERLRPFGPAPLNVRRLDRPFDQDQEQGDRHG